MFYLSCVPEAEIDQITYNFKDITPGWNGSNQLVSRLSTNIKTPLTNIGNINLNTGIFPTELKLTELCLSLSLGSYVCLTIIDPGGITHIFKHYGTIDVWLFNNL